MNFRSGTTFAVAIAVLSFGLIACGGGGGTGQASTQSVPSTIATPASVPTPSNQLPANTVLDVPVSLYIPVPYVPTGTESTNRKPQYLPSSVQSVSFTQTENGGAVYAGSPVVVRVNSLACSASGSGQTCTAQLTGALGQDAWTVQTFVTNNGTGTPLSTNVATLTVQQGSANILAVTLNPVVSSLAWEPVSGSNASATAAVLPLVMLAKDANNATIVGAGQYVNASNVALPITITSSSTHITPQTASNVTANTVFYEVSDDNIAQIAIDNTLSAGTQTLTAAATGLPSAIYTLTSTNGAITAPVSIAMGVNLATTSAPLTVSETGYGTGTFTFTSPDDPTHAIVSFPGTAVASGGAATITVTQVGGGTAHIVVHDSTTGSASTIVYSTTIGVVLSGEKRH